MSAGAGASYSYLFHRVTVDYGLVQSDDGKVPAVRLRFHPGRDDEGHPGPHESIFIDREALPTLIRDLQALDLFLP